MKKAALREVRPPVEREDPLPDRLLSDPRLLELLALTGVSAFSRRFGLSESSLRRQMRARGLNIRDLVTAWRCRTITSLLSTASSLSALGHQLGFSGAVSLSRWVKAHFGVTPGMLRRKLRESRAIADLLSGDSGRERRRDGLIENVKSDRNGKVQGTGSDETLLG